MIKPILLAAGFLVGGTAILCISSIFAESLKSDLRIYGDRLYTADGSTDAPQAPAAIEEEQHNGERGGYSSPVSEPTAEDDPPTPPARN